VVLLDDAGFSNGGIADEYDFGIRRVHHCSRGRDDRLLRTVSQKAALHSNRQNEDVESEVRFAAWCCTSQEN
jgi:hypothetical protein